MAETVDADGLPAALGSVDYLLHRGEANPRTRSGIMALEILDTSPDWDRFRALAIQHAVARADKRILECTAVVVADALTGGTEFGTTDAGFSSVSPYVTHNYLVDKGCKFTFNAPTSTT